MPPASGTPSLSHGKTVQSNLQAQASDATPVTPPAAAKSSIVGPELLSELHVLRQRFLEQNEFLLIEDFLPSASLHELVASLPALSPAVNRNYIPRHKKGGSVSRFDLDRLAPQFGELYRDPGFKAFLDQLTGVELLNCPDEDPHTYALYYYTQAGDHIGYHYDTSYYRGRRYTVLFGLVNACSNVLEYQMFRDDPTRARVDGAVPLTPGTMIVFNGDKLFHRVTPLGEDETRIVLTLEYVTDTRMHAFRRFVSNMKDAIAYFGMRQVFARRPAQSAR